MKKQIFALGAAALLLAGCSAMGMHRGARMPGMMQQMDTNGDGMVTKQEFMAAHEAMFDCMKGPDGMISLKDMPMHERRMGMEGGKMPCRQPARMPENKILN